MNKCCRTCKNYKYGICSSDIFEISDKYIESVELKNQKHSIVPIIDKDFYSLFFYK